MSSKKIIAGSLVVAVLFASVGIYYYKAKIKADTKETLVGTRVQMVDTAGNLVKNNIPLELNFKATVRVCKVTKVLFAKVSKCKWEDRKFKRVALTSNEGAYTVGTESYRPLTDKEAKSVINYLATEKAGRTLNTDEQARLDRVSAQVISKTSVPTNAQVEGMITEAFKGYVPPATDETKTTESSRGVAPVNQLVNTGLSLGAAVAAGSAATIAGATLVAGGSLAAAGSAVGMAASVGSVAGGSAAAAVSSITGGSAVASTASGVLGEISSGATWLFTSPVGIAVLAGVIILTCFTSTKTTEKWFTLLSADVRPAGDLYTGSPITLYYQKDKDTTSDKYVKESKLAVDLNDFDKAFYSQSADQLYAKFIASNSGIADGNKENYKNILAATVQYLIYARLHSYAEANTNKDIAALVSKIVDGRVVTGTNVGTDSLRNGGFENSIDSWASTPDKGTTEIVDSSSAFTCATGSKCIKMVAAQGTNQHIVQQVGKLEKGKKYVFSADFFANNADGQINLYDNKSGKGYGLVISGNGLWKTATVTVPVESDDNDFYVFVYADKHGTSNATVYYDNLMFAQVN